MGNMPKAAIDDPWQARMDRMRRLLPMPLLLVSTVLALVVTAAQHTWARFDLGLPVVGAAAVWWVVVTARVRPDASTGWRLTAFAVHTALAGFLVWVSLPYGVFAYTGFLLAYGLGSRWRAAGFVATALVVSASLARRLPVGERGADGNLPGSGRARWSHSEPAGAGAESGAGSDGQRTGPEAHRPVGNVQALAAPGGLPLWASEVRPGSTHDLAAARELVRAQARPT